TEADAWDLATAVAVLRRRPGERGGESGRRQAIGRVAQGLEERQVAPLGRRELGWTGDPLDPRRGKTGVRDLGEQVVQRLQRVAVTREGVGRNAERGQAGIDDVPDRLAPPHVVDRG